ncbi:MAG: BtrH N-terminal domain-containing protein [Peptostreptococcaceae bacterium]
MDELKNKVISKFETRGGKHCITTALKQIFYYYNYELTEEMIFGIGCGLSFVYINLEKSPMVSGRTKPFEFEKNIGDRLNIEIKCKSSNKYEVAFRKTLTQLNKDKPVLAYVDMAYLKYLNLDEENHFGGHAVVIFGYDNEKEKFYISDRDNSDNPIRTPNGNISNCYHLVDYKEVENARSSAHRPFPAKNKYLDINFNSYTPVTKDIIIAAIDETCDNMLNAPAQLLGLNGINKFSREILKWKKFSEEKLRIAGITNYFQINADGGTGGGIFRNMYGEFLIQASEILVHKEINQLGLEYKIIAEKWDEVGSLMWKLYETANVQLLEMLSNKIKVIYEDEKRVLTKLKEIIGE